MDRRPLICECGEEFNEDDFAKHFGTCNDFKMQFKEFDQKFGELLKAYSEPKERLIIVKFLLKQYISVIEQKLKQYFSNIGKLNLYNSNKEKNSNNLSYKNKKEVISKNSIKKKKIFKLENEKKIYSKTESSNNKSNFQKQNENEEESEEEEEIEKILNQVNRKIPKIKNQIF